MLRDESVRIGRDLTLWESCDVIGRYVDCHVELVYKLDRINGTEPTRDVHLDFLEGILSGYMSLAEEKEGERDGRVYSEALPRR